MQPEKIKVPVECHVGTEDKFVLAEVTRYVHAGISQASMLA